MKRLRILTGLVACLGSASAMAEDFNTLSQRLPVGANTIAIVNIEKIHSSAVGVATGTAARHDRQFSLGVTAVPSDTRRLIAASQVDWEVRKPLWEVVLADMGRKVELATIAAVAGGKVDSIAGVDAVVLPTDAYVLNFNDGIAGAMTPANRQMVARWIASANSSRTSNLSPYLQEAVGVADSVGTEIVMAVDLDAVAHPERLKLKLEEYQATQGGAFDLDAVSKKLASIRGATLGVRVTGRIFGALKIDFREDVSDLNAIAVPLVLEALGDAGMMIEDLHEWTGHATGNQIILEGEMTAPAVRQALSLIDTSFARLHGNTGQASTENGDEAPKSQEYLVLSASQQYFTRVTQMMDDFREKKRNRQTIGQMATWMERYADRIDRMPMLNVDPQLLDFGSYVSDQLRGGSSAIRGSARTTREQQSTAVTAGTGGFYEFNRYGFAGGGSGAGTWWRPYSLTEQQQVRTNLRIQSNNASNTSAQQTIQNISQATAEVRRAMVDKYKVEF